MNIHVYIHRHFYPPDSRRNHLFVLNRITDKQLTTSTFGDAKVFAIQLNFILGFLFHLLIRDRQIDSYLSFIHGKAAEALYIGSLIQTRLGVVSSLFPIDQLLLAFKNLLLIRIHQTEEIIKVSLPRTNNATELEVVPATSITASSVSVHMP